MTTEQQHVLVLLAGAPGTGKTYTAAKIMQAIHGFVSLPLDLFNIFMMSWVSITFAKSRCLMPKPERVTIAVLIF